MLKVYKADTEVIRTKLELSSLLRTLPEKFHERAIRYKFEQDAWNYVVGRLLLKKGLEEFSQADQIEGIHYQEDGKPFLDNIDFNISHSGNTVVCALSVEGSIGIDLEKHKLVNLNDFKPWFTSLEWENIQSDPSSLKKFYWYWTRKESIIKAMGVNLSYLHQIELDVVQDIFTENNKQWHLMDLHLGPEIYTALCTEFKAKKIEIIEYSAHQFTP